MEQGLSLTSPDGLVKQFIKSVLETALEEEMTQHLGHEKNRAAEGRESTNTRNGNRPQDGPNPQRVARLRHRRPR